MDEYKKKIEKLNREKMPSHIGVIMDGNGRWAKKMKKPRIYGHREGTNAVRRIIEAAVEIGLDVLTIYAFSTENWRRPKKEVHALLNLIKNSLLKEINIMSKNNINVRFIGSKINLPDGYRDKLDEVSKKSWDNTGLKLNIAMNYGGRQELLHAVKDIGRELMGKKIGLNEITQELISKKLYTNNLPDPDLIIRTSGEKRLSNFLVWQSAYSELWFTETLWPDFSKEEFIKAILDYQTRKRRFGDIK